MQQFSVLFLLLLQLTSFAQSLKAQEASDIVKKLEETKGELLKNEQWEADFKKSLNIQPGYVMAIPRKNGAYYENATITKVNGEQVTLSWTENLNQLEKEIPVSLLRPPIIQDGEKGGQPGFYTMKVGDKIIGLNSEGKATNGVKMVSLRPKDHVNYYQIADINKELKAAYGKRIKDLEHKLEIALLQQKINQLVDVRLGELVEKSNLVKKKMGEIDAILVSPQWEVGNLTEIKLDSGTIIPAIVSQVDSHSLEVIPIIGGQKLPPMRMATSEIALPEIALSDNKSKGDFMVIHDKIPYYINIKGNTLSAQNILPSNFGSSLLALGSERKKDLDKEISALNKEIKSIKDGIKNSNPTALTKISQSQCEQQSFDNKKLMAADTDQGKSPTCWAHAISALLEEQLCIAQPEHCGKLVSRTDVAGHSSEINSYMDSGNSSYEAMQSYLNDEDSEVCLDKYAVNPVDFSRIDFINLLKNFYKSFASNANCTQVQTSTVLNAQVQGHYSIIFSLLHLKDSSWSVAVGQTVFTEDAFKKILLSSKNESEFTKNILTFYCSNKLMKKSFKRSGVKLKVENTSYANDAYFPLEDKGDFRKVEMLPFLVELARAKKAGHSLYFGFCYDPFIRNYKKEKSGKAPQEFSSTDKCGNHAVVVNGLKWNSAQKTCEVQLKNSHGKGAQLESGWYPAELFFSHSLTSTFYNKAD